MRAFVCLILCIVTPFVFSDTVNKETASVLIETWYSASNLTNVTQEVCCVPAGTISVSVNSTKRTAATNFTNIILSATSWVGDACSTVGFTPDTKVSVPFNDTASYNDLSVDSLTYNNKRIGFEFSNFETGTWGNGTGKVVVDLELFYNRALNVFHGDNCTVTLSRKSSTIVSAFGAVFMTVAALFAF